MAGEMYRFVNTLQWVESHTPEEIVSAMKETLPGMDLNVDTVREDRRGTAVLINHHYCLKQIAAGKLTLDAVNADRAANNLDLLSAPEGMAPKESVQAANPAMTRDAALKDIPIAQIDLSECIRAFDDPEKTQALAEEIAAVGLMHPIVVREDGDKFVLIAGKRRVEAYKLLGWTSIPGTVFTVDVRRSLDMQGSENFHRNDFTPLETLSYVRKQLSMGKTQKAIAQSIRMADSNMSGVVRVANNLAPDVETQLRKMHPNIAMDTMQELVAVSHEEQRLIIAELLGAEHIAKSDVKSKTAPKVPKASKQATDESPEADMEPVAAETELTFQMVVKECLASVRSWKGEVSEETKQMLLDLNADILELLNREL